MNFKCRHLSVSLGYGFVQVWFDKITMGWSYVIHFPLIKDALQSLGLVFFFMTHNANFDEEKYVSLVVECLT